MPTTLLTTTLLTSPRRGFTLIELVMSVALISIIAGIGIPVFRDMQVRNDLSLAENAMASTLRRAQVLSMSPEGDTSWGANAQSGEVILFKGASFAARDTSYDEIFAISPTIVVSGTTEFVFAKFTGLPGTTGTLTLTSSDGDARNVSVNEKGSISY